MDYFNFEEKQVYLDEAGKKYDSKSKGTSWYFDTRKKLEHLSNFLGKNLSLNLVKNYSEKPNGQAGQGKGFVLKKYVLGGFIPKDLKNKAGEDIFLKLTFYISNSDLYFAIDCDTNFSNKNNKYNKIRKKINKETHKSWKVDNNFPGNYNDLVNLISDNFKGNVEVLRKYISKHIDVTIESEISNKIKFNTMPLNQILYGPPGTGKTYSIIDKVVEICEPTKYDSSNREVNKKTYDELINEGRAFFTTFHQSMSYEDFIEGIKPIPPREDSDNIQYKIEDGVFKSVCEQCLDEIKEFKNQIDQTPTNEVGYQEKYAEFVRQIQAKIIKVKTRSGLDVRITKVSPAGNMRLTTGEDTKDYIISANRLKRLIDEIPDPESVTNVHDEVRGIIGGSHSSLYFAALSAFKEFENKYIDIIKEEGRQLELEEIQLSKTEIDELPKYVFVIDEINRGNVSAIFGELITLLEEDKRYGMQNQMLVKLPYSKTNFTVPPNLYIIGTMNTADRSVEALDTALRRRFSFTEMLPLYDIDEQNATLQYKYANTTGKDILKTINSRIEKLLDRDHLIGHSYFLVEKESEPKQKLMDSFYRNIIPLLQEYFYGDYAKIGAVLGKGFIYKVEEKEETMFASGFDQEDFSEKDVYQIIDYRENQPGNEFIQNDMDFEKAIRLLMNKSNNNTIDE